MNDKDLLADLTSTTSTNGLHHLILVSSTTGDGEQPEQALPFISHVVKAASNLDNLRYTILGLGDTNYSQVSTYRVGPGLFVRSGQNSGAKKRAIFG